MKTIFQLIDQDNEQWGLVLTNAPEIKVKELFSDYMNNKLDNLPQQELEVIGYPDELDADGFCSYLRLNGFRSERVFVTEINA